MTLEAIIMCLALNIFYEANTEPKLGKQAVAHVTLNRTTKDKNVCQVVYEPKQFSWVTMPLSKPSKEALDESKQIARDALFGRSKDPTGGATYFHSVSIKPSWAYKLKTTAQIGGHIFYKSR